MASVEQLTAGWGCTMTTTATGQPDPCTRLGCAAPGSQPSYHLCEHSSTYWKNSPEVAERASAEAARARGQVPPCPVEPRLEAGPGPTGRPSPPRRRTYRCSSGAGAAQHTMGDAWFAGVHGRRAV